MPMLRPSQPTLHFSPASDSAGDPQLRADIAGRLRRVCDHMTPEAFDALVGDIHGLNPTIPRSLRMAASRTKSATHFFRPGA